MITEDYVSFETAKLLKEKRFNEPCFAYYSEFIDNWRTLKTWKKHAKTYHTVRNDGYILVPTLQMAMKWLREEKGVYIEIPIVGMEWEAPTKWYFGWRCQTKDVIDRLRSQDANYTSYEEAAEEAIKYCLKNLI